MFYSGEVPLYPKFETNRLSKPVLKLLKRTVSRKPEIVLLGAGGRTNDKL